MLEYLEYFISIIVRMYNDDNESLRKTFENTDTWYKYYARVGLPKFRYLTM